MKPITLATYCEYVMNYSQWVAIDLYFGILADKTVSGRTVKSMYF